MCHVGCTVSVTISAASVGPYKETILVSVVSTGRGEKSGRHPRMDSQVVLTLERFSPPPRVTRTYLNTSESVNQWLVALKKVTEHKAD